jgi:hypothetical protein
MPAPGRSGVASRDAIFFPEVRMSWNDLTDVILALMAVLASVPFLVRREWAATAVAPPLRPAPQSWMTGPGAYESFVAGGVRALLDRSPMRYDVAIYSGGGS